MKAAGKDITKLLKKLDINYRYEEHEAVFTVAESSKVLAEKIPIKNLLLQDDKKSKTFLVIMNGEEKLDVKNLAKQLGVKKLQFAKPEVLKEKLGVTPGAVSLFGILHRGSLDVEVVIDAKLTNEPEIGFHPNDNTATIFMNGSAIEKILKRTGHKYRLITLY